MSNTTPKNRLGDLFPAGLSQVDGLFEHFFGPASFGPASVRPFAASWGAPASVWEAENHLHVELDAPGVAKSDVDVTFDKGQLSISVTRSRPEDRRYVHNERGHGKVTRTLALPETVDPDSIEATLTDGVLHVSIAKRPEAQPKKIELK